MCVHIIQAVEGLVFSNATDSSLSQYCLNRGIGRHTTDRETRPLVADPKNEFDPSLVLGLTVTSSELQFLVPLARISSSSGPAVSSSPPAENPQAHLASRVKHILVTGIEPIQSEAVKLLFQ